MFCVNLFEYYGCNIIHLVFEELFKQLAKKLVPTSSRNVFVSRTLYLSRMIFTKKMIKIKRIAKDVSNLIANNFVRRVHYMYVVLHKFQIDNEIFTFLEMDADIIYFFAFKI